MNKIATGLVFYFYRSKFQDINCHCFVYNYKLFILYIQYSIQILHFNA